MTQTRKTLCTIIPCKIQKNLRSRGVRNIVAQVQFDNTARTHVFCCVVRGFKFSRHAIVLTSPRGDPRGPQVLPGAELGSGQGERLTGGRDCPGGGGGKRPRGSVPSSFQLSQIWTEVQMLHQVTNFRLRQGSFDTSPGGFNASIRNAVFFATKRSSFSKMTKSGVRIGSQWPPPRSSPTDRQTSCTEVYLLQRRASNLNAQMGH